VFQNERQLSLNHIFLFVAPADTITLHIYITSTPLQFLKMAAIYMPSPITKTFGITSTEGFNAMSQENKATSQVTRTDAPQRTWSTIECRMWLLKLLRDNIGLEADVAVRYALKFNGQGTTMLGQSVGKWKADFGDAAGEIIQTTITAYTQTH
jgi:hypothetical protein